MCTAFVMNKNDYIAGYNLDIDPGIWNYRVYLKESVFYIGIKVGSTVYKTHGVNNKGQFGALPYMNGPEETVNHRGSGYQRIDLLNDKWIGRGLSYQEIQDILKNKELVNIAGCSMHLLLADRDKHMILIEPGSGHKTFDDKNYTVVTNYPLIDTPKDLSNQFFGADRFAKTNEMLESRYDSFSVADGFEVLKAVCQEGQWATRVSFVYSGKENAVYYCIDRDFDHLQKHCFE